MKELKNIKELFKYTRRYSMWLGLGGLMLVATSLINIGIAEGLRKLTDYAINRNWAQFIKVIGYLLAMILLGFLFKYNEKYFVGKFTSTCLVSIRSKFVKQLIEIKIDILEGLSSAEILSTFSNDMRKLEIFFQSHSVNLIYQTLVFIVSFIYLVTIDKKATLIIILVVPLVILISTFLTRSIGSVAGDVQNSLGKSNIIVQDIIRGIYTVKSFNLEGVFKNKYNKSINNYTNYGVCIDKKVFYMDMIIAIFQLAPYMIFCLYGEFLLKSSLISIGDLIAFLNLFDYLYMSLCEIQYSINDIKIDMASIGRIFYVLTLPIEEGGCTKEPKINKTFSDPIIAFNNVSFSYDNKKNILENITFNINCGQKIVVIGPSGSGKSTIFKLMINFYNNYTGDISLFGNNIRQWNIEKLRSQISIVSQEVHLFSGTIKENISFGKVGCNMEEIIQAAKKANAHEFIIKLPMGYDTEVAENSSNFSGGEKQRIAIARAIIKNAPVLFLDEATSALDAHSEEMVQVALNNLMEGKTTLIITHNLKSIKNYDNVLVIKDGKAIVKEKHLDLMASYNWGDR